MLFILMQEQEEKSEWKYGSYDYVGNSLLEELCEYKDKINEFGNYDFVENLKISYENFMVSILLL